MFRLYRVTGTWIDLIFRLINRQTCLNLPIVLRVVLFSLSCSIISAIDSCTPSLSRSRRDRQNIVGKIDTAGPLCHPVAHRLRARVQTLASQQRGA